MVRGLLTLLLAGALAACGGKEPEPVVRFSLALSPAQPVSTYGELVEMKFTVTSECSGPVVLERVDGVLGRRHEIAKFREVVDLPVRREGNDMVLDPAAAAKSRFFRAEALLRPGDRFSFTRRIRAIEPGVEIVLIAMPVKPEEIRGSWWLPDEATRGRWHLASPIRLDEYRPAAGAVLIPTEGKLPDVKMAAAAAKLAVPPAPFERPPRASGPWTWSQALGGYVVRRGPGVLELYGPDEPAPLPDLPFEFLDELDAAKGGVKVLAPDGEVETVTADAAADFLERVRRKDLSVDFSEHPEEAPFELVP